MGSSKTRDAKPSGYVSYTPSRQERINDAWGDEKVQCEHEHLVCSTDYHLLLLPVSEPVLTWGATPSWVEAKFIRLRDEWRAQRGPHSSSAKLAMHPSYQKIIGMGPAVVPLLLRELEKRVESWFWALNAITEENPVSEEEMGDGDAMARAWIKWGRDRGYQW